MNSRAKTVKIKGRFVSSAARAGLRLTRASVSWVVGFGVGKAMVGGGECG
mgnify:CR=1 FL=1